MIEMLRFNKHYRTFIEGESITFGEGVNLLVGDQGCGKSTMLQVLCKLLNVPKAFWRDDVFIRDMRVVATVSTDLKPMQVFAHDYENDSPRTSASFETMGMLPLKKVLGQKKMSHGEANCQLINLIEQFENTILILDEPDSGLSCRSALKLAAALKRLEAQGCQILASVHHPWVIEAFPKVLSVEKRKWISSKDFLESLRGGLDSS